MAEALRAEVARLTTLLATAEPEPETASMSASSQKRLVELEQALANARSEATASQQQLAKAEAERASAREACEDLKAVLESMKACAEGPGGLNEQLQAAKEGVHANIAARKLAEAGLEQAQSEAAEAKERVVQVANRVLRRWMQSEKKRIFVAWRTAVFDEAAGDGEAAGQIEGAMAADLLEQESALRDKQVPRRGPSPRVRSEILPADFYARA